MKKIKKLLQQWLKIEPLMRDLGQIKKELKIQQRAIKEISMDANWLISECHKQEKEMKELRGRLNRSDVDYRWWDTNKVEFLKQVSDWVNNRIKEYEKSRH